MSIYISRPHSLMQWLEYFRHRHSLNFSVVMPPCNFIYLPKRTCSTKHLSCTARQNASNQALPYHEIKGHALVQQASYQYNKFIVQKPSDLFCQTSRLIQFFIPCCFVMTLNAHAFPLAQPRKQHIAHQKMAICSPECTGFFAIFSFCLKYLTHFIHFFASLVLFFCVLQTVLVYFNFYTAFQRKSSYKMLTFLVHFAHRVIFESFLPPLQ